MKKSIQKLSLFSIALSLGITTQVFSQKATINKTFRHVTQITLNLKVGNVHMEKSTNGQTGLSVVYNEKDLEVNIYFENSQLEIVEKINRKNGNDDAPVYTLKIPEGINVKTNTGSGDIRGEDLSANLQGTTGSGDIHLYRFNGTARMNAGNGNIAVEEAEGKLSFSSGFGHVSLQDVSGAINANTATGNLQVVSIWPTEKATFNAGKGDALLVLHHPVTTDISLKSGAGTALLDLNGCEFEGTLIMTCQEGMGEIVSDLDFDRTATKDRVTKKYKRYGNSGVQLTVGTGTGKARVRQ